MKINWKVRIKNPIFFAQFILSIMLPMLAYMGLTVHDLTSWTKIGEVFFAAVQNPYVLGLIVISAFNAIHDPTTAGFSDSKQALTYCKPKKED